MASTGKISPQISATAAQVSMAAIISYQLLLIVLIFLRPKGSTE
jgi:hypothetical protein